MLKKGDLYFPTKEFQKKAVISDPKIYQKAIKDPVKFWEKLAKGLFWFERWKKTFEHEPPYFKWFLGGKINITTNIFEKNKLGWKKIKNKPAIIWEPEPTNEKPRILTYEDLFKRVCKFANALKKLGVKKGDIVAIYLPMIPEVVVSMLSCARIGAVHLVVFSAFSPSALKTRLQISNAKILITAESYFRRGKIINLKESADEGIKGTDVEKVIVVERLGREIPWDEKRDIWFDELIKNESENCKPEIMDSEDPFFILPESGTTGEFLPILHTFGGYTVQAYWNGKWVFDFQEDSILWSMGDVGWITGHTYTVYSPLLNGITTLIYEGAPDFPEKDRWAKVIEKYKVSIFYTSPTAIRMFRKLNGEITKKYNFKNLRVLGSVGEPIDSSSWLWYFKEIGKEKCPIVDTYWQTETGGIVISSLPGIGPFKPAFAGLPFPGIKVDILDERGNSCKVGERGNLVILPPFSPGMLRGLYKKPEKYKKVYWGKYGDNIYFTSDGAFRDENGLIRIVGRVDDIIKIAGHRISTGELEEAVNSHEKIVESAVVGVPDEIKGEVPVIFAIYKGKKEEIKKEILEIIRKRIGPIAPPKEIYLVEDLPRTKSGKIVRKILRELMLGEEIKDLSALANPESVDKIKKLIKK
jgi:acetyl-CoA synthetase